jgi:U3 small nucleolar RNA-associated protein 14
MWKNILAPQWIRRVAAMCLMVLASALFLLNLRRQGERAGRAAERMTNLERTNHVQHEMLDAATDRPRNRDNLVDRLRKGGF